MIKRSTIMLFLVLFSSSSVIADQWWDGFAVHGFSGQVTDVQVMGSDILAGGEFTANGTTYTPSMAVWNGSAWQALASQPPFSQPTHIAIIDGMVVTNGVNPSWIPDGPYRWTGQQWEIMGSGLSGGYINRIECSTIYAGQSVVGGFFGGLVAFWDGADWVAGTLDGDGVALDLEVYDGDLYAAGDVFLFGFPESRGLARWNGEQWVGVTAMDPDTWSAQSGFSLDGDFGWTTSLEVYQDKLVISGNFNQIGSMATSNVVTLDAQTGMWGQLAGLDDVPEVLAVFEGELYAGGPAGLIPGAVGPGSLGRLVAGSWAEAGSSPRGTVNALTADTSLLVSGLFDGAGEILGGNFITWDGNAYSTRANPGGQGFNGEVRDLAVHDGVLLAGGAFSLAGSEAISGLARWDGTGWLPFAGGGVDGAVWAVHSAGGNLYIAGDFSTVDSQPLAQIARFDGFQWSGYSSPLPSTPTLVTFFGGELYAGSRNSYRDEQNSLRRGYLARWTGSAWDLIITDGYVLDLAEFDGALWAAVDYFELDGTYPSLVAFDGTTLTAPVPGVEFTAGVEVMGNQLYIMNDYGDIQTWDGMQLEYSGPTQLDLPQQGGGFGLGTIKDLYPAGDRVYIGSTGDYSGYTAWEWDLASGIAAPLDLGTNGTVYAIESVDGAMFFAGRFTLAGIPFAMNFNAVGNPVPSGGIARWNLGASAVDVQPAVVRNFGLENHPNPFNPSTTISFNLPGGAESCRLEVFDLRGRLMRTFDLGRREAGPGSVVWDGKDGRGQAVSSGIYFSRLEADGIAVSRPMTLIK